MTRKSHLLQVATAAMAFGCTLCSSDRPPKFETSFKLRTGIQIASFEDNLKHANYGFGAVLGYNIAKKDTISIELGWAYKPGDEFRADLSNLPISPNAPTPPTHMAGRTKNEVQGLSLRAAYERQFEYFGAIGGLQIGGSRFKHEYYGNVANTSSDAASLGAGLYRDSYWGTLYNNPNSISPFLGLTKRFGKNSAIEINLMSNTYESAEYVHVVGQALGGNAVWDDDFSVTNKRTALHLEFGYVVRF
ncbi:MAG: outer membrane beta-barrel protein [Holophagaceae bacterium]|nr:outer membrane beta-barrel protein [Holophagaceae bacterium]